jgi:membrane associated rhomboid family serine protease
MKNPIIPVTIAIIGINAAVFAFTAFVNKTNRSARLSDLGLGIYAKAVADGELWRVLSSGFLHFGVVHIASNMFGLYQVGRVFENQIGKARFLGLYFAAMCGGAAGAMLLEPRGLTGGASGALFGMFGAGLIAQRMRSVPFSKSAFGPLILINLVITFSIPGISKGGHLGGLLFGALAGAVILNPKVRHRDLAKDLGFLGFLIALGLGLTFVIAKANVG